MTIILLKRIYRSWYFAMIFWLMCDLFLMADDREILKDVGKITAEIAKSKAETEFEKYRIIQDKQFIYDYDRYLLELEESIKE